MIWHYTLIKSKNSKKYIFKITAWGIFGHGHKLREILDPFNNRSAGYRAWKFNSKDEAESLILIAKLKGLL